MKHFVDTVLLLHLRVKPHTEVKTVYAITSTQLIYTGSAAFNPHTSSDDGMGHLGHQSEVWLVVNEWNACTTNSASTASLRTSSVDLNTKYRSSTQRNVPALETAVWGYHRDDRVVWHLHQPISLSRLFFSAQYGQWWKTGKLWKWWSHCTTVYCFNSFHQRKQWLKEELYFLSNTSC